MTNISKDTSFFLEAYSQNGLCSLLEGFYKAENARRVYLITGGIGAVSSLLIKTVSDKLRDRGVVSERISNALCSNQLDAVCFPELQTYMSNGGERGCLSSEFPVAVEKTVSLTEVLNCEAIEQNSDEIKKLFCEEREAKKRAVGFLSAAESLISDTRTLSKRYTDFDKISRFAFRLARREFPVIAGRCGREEKRFLSNITHNGIETYSGTLTNMCNKFYVLSDCFGATASQLPGLIKSYALASGYDVISCYCPITGDMNTEHIIVPERSLCFFCENDYHPADFTSRRRISANRFTNLKGLSEHKARITFNKRAANEMLMQAVKLFKAAENTRNKLMLIYLSCTDETKLLNLSEKIASEILASAQ